MSKKDGVIVKMDDIAGKTDCPKQIIKDGIFILILGIIGVCVSSNVFGELSDVAQTLVFYISLLMIIVGGGFMCYYDF